ncbi:hypothetical protein L596_017550 [Steinernema carpocapsae]|uniref:Neuropeptide-like protein 31 n=1 Tax=Steinernema carpocapsae TaxID=34508 RepID=A0A4U5N205_STECR|nr:hypothetical protein L596_017550 [Steinernema carpocapsae]
MKVYYCLLVVALIFATVVSAFEEADASQDIRTRAKRWGYYGHGGYGWRGYGGGFRRGGYYGGGHGYGRGYGGYGRGYGRGYGGYGGYRYHRHGYGGWGR